MTGTEALAQDIVRIIINPLLLLVSAVGTLVFVFGIVEFVYGLSSESEARENGKKHMLWGLVGMLIMIVAYGVVRLIIGAVDGEVPALYR